MITLIELNKFSEKYRVPIETIEKDYIISWILFCLSKSKLKEKFVFYGGTAIKRIFFEEHRFSEDIDLISSEKISLSEILEEMSCLKQAAEKANLKLEINKNSIINNEDRNQLNINYEGYEEISGPPKEVRLDFSMDMKPYWFKTNQKMIESYSDLTQSNVILSVMSINTILSCKLGLLMCINRNEPRDLFDIWFLLNRKDKFDYNFNQIYQSLENKMVTIPCLTCFYPNWIRLHLKQTGSIG